jgi:hypothetical protein
MNLNFSSLLICFILFQFNQKVLDVKQNVYRILKIFKKAQNIWLKKHESKIIKIKIKSTHKILLKCRLIKFKF